MNKQLIDQAIEALEIAQRIIRLNSSGIGDAGVEDTLTALRAAIAQPAAGELTDDDRCVRYCPECGRIGALPEDKNCCPDSFGMSVRRWQAEKMERMLNRLRATIAAQRERDAQQGAVAKVVEHGATVRLEWASVEAAHNAKPGLLFAAPQSDEARDAARDVLAERRRQISAEGWTTDHDDEHCNGELARAAGAYALYAASTLSNHPGVANDLKFFADKADPWGAMSMKALSSTERRNLVKAGALILAEIERLDREAMSTTKGAK